MTTRPQSIPECIEGGKAPCPICPVRDKCDYAAKILRAGKVPSEIRRK